MQVTFTHDGAKKDGTLMIGQGIFGDLYESIDTIKAKLSDKYSIPNSDIDISFGPTQKSWTGD